eukprot:snap_masked-scaffold_42-processed-gene-2.14-mRNA-1 protein AED:0.13 eAED:1.00 QI:0/-1/0/1/-1/1/1/0/176
MDKISDSNKLNFDQLTPDQIKQQEEAFKTFKQEQSDSLLAQSLLLNQNGTSVQTTVNENLSACWEIKIPEKITPERIFQVNINEKIHFIQIPPGVKPYQKLFFSFQNENHETKEDEIEIDEEKMKFLDELPEDLREETLNSDSKLRKMYKKAKRNQPKPVEEDLFEGFDDPLLDFS